MKLWEDENVPLFRVQKRLTEHQLCLCEMLQELKTFVLEHPEVQQVFIEPAVGEHDSQLRSCYKLEIKSHYKDFKIFEFWYMKQSPVEHCQQ